MGRGFKTAKASFVDDIIYQPPWELAKSVIEAQDKRIDKAEGDIDAFNTLTEDMENIKTDDPGVLEAIRGYRGQADEIAEGMQGDYANYQKYLPQISSLQKQLRRDMSTGVLGRAGEAFADKTSEEAEIDALVKSKEITGERATALKKYYSSRYEEKGGLGYKSETEYNRYLEEEDKLNPIKKFDTQSFRSNLKANFASDTESWASATPTNNYIESSSGTRTYIKSGAIEKYLATAPEMVDWEKDIKQEALLQSYNAGLRGKALDNTVEGIVAEKKKGFIEGTGEALGFNKTTTTKSLKGDPVAMARDKAAKTRTPVVTIDVASDRRNNVDKVKGDKYMAGIKVMAAEANKGLPLEEQLDTSSDSALYSRMNKEMKAGNLESFMQKYNLGNLGGVYIAQNDPRLLRDLVKKADRIGKTISLVDPPKVGEVVTYQTQTAKRLAIKGAIENLDVSQPYKVEVSNDYGMGTKDTQATVMEMFKQGLISIDNIGGKTVKTTGKELFGTGVEEDIEDGDPIQRKVWYAEGRGVTPVSITFADGTYPTTQEEAMVAAQETGLSLKTKKTISSQDVLGNKIGLVGATVDRFKSDNDRVDNYEVNITLQKIVNGKKVFVRAKVLIPAKDIQAKTL